MKSAENTNWAKHLNKRIMAELTGKGYKQVDICSHRLMMTNPLKMYAVVVVDCDIYPISGHSENEMIQILLDRIGSKTNATSRELIYQY